jgi:hypothetical protein
MGYDIEPMITLNEKKNLLPKAVDENWIFFFEHDPINPAGKIKITDKGYAFGETINI